MTNNSIKILIAIILCAGAGAGAGAGESFACESEISIARRFYELDGNFNLKDFSELRSRFSVDLAKLLEKTPRCSKTNDSCAIDWNPWTGGQDGSIVGSPRFDLYGKTRHSARVRITVQVENGANSLQSIKSVLLLSRDTIGTCWVIKDLEMPGNGSLAALLKRQ